MLETVLSHNVAKETKLPLLDCIHLDSNTDWNMWTVFLLIFSLDSNIFTMNGVFTD